MDLIIPLFSGISLKIANGSVGGNVYPTSQLQKGLILVYNGHELAEEGVGFGVPVLKLGLRTIFSGEVEIISLHKSTVQEIVATFTMNLEERLTRQSQVSVRSKTLYVIKNVLAGLHRRFPQLRGLLTAVSNAVRWIFGWETIFTETEYCMNVKMIYCIDWQKGIIHVEVDMTDLPEEGITEVVVMNEQGARHFDQYQDSNGNSLQGKEIGNWDEVTAEEASFICSTHRLAFTLRKIKGARLFRGRELIGSRLAWSGFGYSFHPRIKRIDYQVRIEKLP